MQRYHECSTIEERIQYLCDHFDELAKCMDKDKAEQLLKDQGILDKDGHLTTNYHTQEQADEYNKRFKE